MSESVFFWFFAEYFNEAVKNGWHPPIYIILLHFFRELFSGNYIGGYFIGILSVICSGFLIYKIIALHERKIEEKTSLLMIIVLVYYSLPIVIQGVFIFDIDNTILTPILLLIYYSYTKFNKNQKWSNGILLLFFIILGLWIKMTTPILILCSIIFFNLINKDFRFLLFKIFPIFFIALFLFYISYGWLYSEYILEGNNSVQYNQGKAALFLSGHFTFNQPLKDFVFSITSNLGAIILWSSPPIALLIVFLFTGIIQNQNLLTLKWIEKKLDQKYILPSIIIASIIINYSFLIKVQATAGFPKYHYPLFSFFFIILGIYLTQSNIKFKKSDIGFFIVTLTVISLLTKDTLYPFYDLGRTKQIKTLLILFIKTCLVMFLPIIIYCFVKKKAKIKTFPDIMMVLLVFALIANFSGFIYRSQADYSTNYHYGIKGTNEALIYAQKIPINKSVYFPFVGFLLKRQERSKTAPWGRLLGESPFKPNTDYIIMTDTMLNRNKFFFGIDQVKVKYHRILTIKSYGIWKKNNI